VDQGKRQALNEYEDYVSLNIEDPSSKLGGMFCLTAVLRSDRKER
jgi:hypothetical protein